MSSTCKIRHIILALVCVLPMHAAADNKDTLHAAAGDTIAPQLIHDVWFSHDERIFRHVDIYLPAAYDTCSQPLPVVYLLHGINGYEGEWMDKGHAADTLERLMAAGLCPPVILVMPDCNRWPIRQRPLEHGNLWRCLVRYPRLSREHEVECALSDLIDMIDSTYCVSSCAIAGLSDGGRIAANTANRRPERLHTVGLFSPVLHKDQLPRDPTQTYYIYAGKADIFFPNTNRFHRRLQRAGYTHTFTVMHGSHNWQIWRTCLSDLLQKL